MRPFLFRDVDMQCIQLRDFTPYPHTTPLHALLQNIQHPKQKLEIDPHKRTAYIHARSGKVNTETVKKCVAWYVHTQEDTPLYSNTFHPHASTNLIQTMSLMYVLSFEPKPKTKQVLKSDAAPDPATATDGYACSDCGQWNETSFTMKTMNKVTWTHKDDATLRLTSDLSMEVSFEKPSWVWVPNSMVRSGSKLAEPPFPRPFVFLCPCLSVYGFLYHRLSRTKLFRVHPPHQHNNRPPTTNR